MIKFTLPDIPKVVQEVSRQVFDKVKERTPVNTGYAKSRWTITEENNRSIINNDAPYIGVLEDGSSQQAPVGMVGVTLDEVPQMIAEAIEKNQKTL